MASIKNLKKDINYVLGDVIGYAQDVSILKNARAEGDKIIDETITVFDDLVARLNAKVLDNKKAHYKAISADLEEKAKALVEKVNKL